MTKAITAMLTGAMLAALPMTAQAEGPVPAQRFIVEDAVDFYGGDIRSIFDTTLENCEAICLREKDCVAYTFNTAKGACFPKSVIGERTPFEAAMSGRLVDVPQATRDRAQAIAADLDALRPADFRAASRLAESIGRRYPVATGADVPTLVRAATAAGSNVSAAETAQGRIVALSDTPDAWLDLGRTYQARMDDDWQYRGWAVSSALNGVLRAAQPATRATALGQLADALEEDGRGRTGIDMLKASLTLAPRQTTRDRLAQMRLRHGFRIVNHSVDSDAAAPRACVTFSEPVAEGVDLEPYARVAGADLPVEASDRQVCIDGLEHGERYALTLRAGLPAAAPGEELRESLTIDLYVRDRAPDIRFSGRSYILPKTAEAALPITTVNLDEVDLRLHRVDDRNLLRSIQERFFTANLDEYRENDLRDQLGSMVWEGTGEVERRLNEDVVTRLPLAEAIGTFEPGVYVATARVPGQGEAWEDAATQWFVVTDLGLTTTLADDGLHVFVNGLSGAAAQDGVTLTLLARNNEVLGEATTDTAGYATFAPGLTRGLRGSAPALLTAERGAGDFAFLDLTTPGFDLSDRGVEGRAAPGPVDVFATTERGAYRPGETVHATILARDTRAEAVENLPLTVVIERPDGVEHWRRSVEDEGAGGRSISVALTDSAMRGTWSMRVHADPDAAALSRLSFLVEDFLPQRVDFDLTAPEGAISLADTPAIGVEAVYLYGAPAAALPIEGAARIEAVRTLPAYPGYEFGLADEAQATWLRPLEPGFQTDDAGRASIPLTLPEGVQSSRPLSLTAIIRVRDGSGRPVERTLDMPLDAQRPLIGLRSLSDGSAMQGGDEAQFEAIALGPDGTRIAMEGAVWTLSRLNTRYQWYNLDGRWDYEPITTRERVASGTVDIGTDAAADIAAEVDWGRYELRIAAQNDPSIASSTRFTAGWYAPVAGSGTPDTLQVALDAEAYAPGDTATLRVEARHGGTLLVQVLGGGLIGSMHETVTEGTSEIALTVTEDWGAGAYVVATLLRPMDVAAKRNPARAMGLAWVPVDPGARALNVAFVAGAEAAPRGPLDASVTIDGLAAGTRAHVTVAAVDVGVLNVTGFEFPAAEDHYFGQRAMGAEMRDAYGRLIDGLDGAMGQVRSGGGALGANAAPPPIEDLVALFSGVVETDARGVAQVSFDIPDFNGTIRLMATAWTAGAIGSTTQDVLVRDPIVVSVTAPRFLAPGDESRVLIELAHAFGETGETSIALEADPGLQLGETTRSVTLEKGEQVRLSIPVTGAAVGDPEIRLVTTTPAGARLTKTLRLPVRANDPVVARRNRIPLAAGGSFTLDDSAFAGLALGTGRASLVIGPLATFDTAGMLNGLDLYPYGCTEQTASRALPLLYYADVARNLGLAPDGEIEARVSGAIRRILANQAGSGGFGLWQPIGGDFWLDAYITDFLSRARGAGYAVPDRAFEAALANLRNRVAYAGDFDAGGEALAYALMVLAREGSAAIGDLRYYADAKAEALGSPLAQAQLGAALALYGEQRRADAMFRLASRTRGGDRGWRADYGTPLRDTAGVLALAVEAGSQVVDTTRLTNRITDGFAAKAHTSTQEKVWTLLAANALLKDATLADIRLNDRALTDAVVQITAGEPVTLENTGEEAVSAMLTTFGVPVEPEPAGGNGYALTRTYYTLEGEVVSPETVARDTRLVVVLDVAAERDARARLMVDDALPAGFEIDNPSLLRAGDIASLDWLPDTALADHAEFRSDRFIAAVSGTGDFSLAYIVRAISPGVFHHPAALVEDMYRPEFRARTAAGTVEVTVE